MIRVTALIGGQLHTFEHPSATRFTVHEDGDVTLSRGDVPVAVYINRFGAILCAEHVDEEPVREHPPIEELRAGESVTATAR